MVFSVSGAAAQNGAASAAAPATAPPVAAAPAWVAVPRSAGRLGSADIGLVINTADPYSVAVGEHYALRRRLLPEQVLRVELPLRGVLRPEEFEALRSAIESHFGARTQALALAWVQPYAVECNAITGALALGFDAALCRNSCAPSRASPYANSASARPYADHGLRPSMLLAARDVESARRLIDRGVVADRTLGCAARRRPRPCSCAPTMPRATCAQGCIRRRHNCAAPACSWQVEPAVAHDRA